MRFMWRYGMTTKLYKTKKLPKAAQPFMRVKHEEADGGWILMYRDAQEVPIPLWRKLPGKFFKSEQSAKNGLRVYVDGVNKKYPGYAIREDDWRARDDKSRPRTRT